ncbi:MAG: phospholipid carrier-dependent glycosyltransferase [Chloroflexi bacterium]|nr:phospholipid carrier-dependent glycosyltransferase [Chloroflexota bacterium]
MTRLRHIRLTPRIDALWLLLLAAYILAGTPLVPFHGDESTQIYMSRDYAYQFIQRDLSLVRYSDPPISPAEQYLRLINGTVNKYLMGLAWQLGGFTLADINEQWDWGADWNYNVNFGHKPSDDLLIAARWPSALLLALGVVPMFVLGRWIGGRPVGYLASAYYALNPVLLMNGRRAMMEGSLIAFALLVVVIAIWWLHQRSVFRLTLGAIGLGIVAGLALASKHTNAFVVLTVFGTCAVFPLIAYASGDRSAPLLRSIGVRWAGLALASAQALSVFLLLNPAWWDDPLARPEYVLELRTELLTAQADGPEGYTSLEQQADGFRAFALEAVPQYFEVVTWENYIGAEIVRYEASPWTGVSIGGALIGSMILLGLTIMGLFLLLRRPGIDLAARWVIALWAVAMVATTLLLTPLAWQRYYLPVYPPIGLLAALTIVTVPRVIRERRADQIEATADAR